MTPDEFRLWFPKFASESDDRIAFCLRRAEPHLDSELWGDVYAEGLASLAAHYLATSGKNAGNDAGGPVSALSKSVGDVTISRSFAVSSKAGDDPLMETAYGRAYRALARQVGMGAFAV